MSKHMLVVSQYYDPEPFRINDMCRSWVKRGYQVTVITGIPNYPEGRFYSGYGWFKKRREFKDGITIYRLPILSRGSSSLRLALNYASFMMAGWFWAKTSRIKADVVFNFEVSPMTQALPAIWYAKRRKIPSIIYIQDLWPDNVETVAGVKNAWVLKRLDRMTKRIYTRSTKLLVTSPSFKDTLIERGVSESKVTYWPQYAESHHKPYPKKATNPFTVMFTGNLGDAQGLDVLPRLALALKSANHDDIHFTLVGDGRQKAALIDQINSLEVEDMFTLVGRRPSTDVPKLLSEADCAFLSFKDTPLFHKTIPAKLQTYLACGKPIFAIAAGETKRIIEEANVGLCVEPGDEKAALKALITLKKTDEKTFNQWSKNAVIYAKKHFDKKTLMDQFDAMVEEIKHV